MNNEGKIMRYAIPITCVSVFSMMNAACVANHPIHYYAVHRPIVTDAPPKANGLVLLVGRIAAPEALEDARIRYRSGANEVGAYEYHRWVDRPGTMIRELLVQTLRASGQYRQVQEAPSFAAGDFLIRGELYEFSEVDAPGIETRISLQLEVVAGKSGLVVWSRNFNRDETVTGKTIEDVVTSLDHNLQQVVTESASGVESFLSNPR
jgi:ABC-type uncharacterized transport system auxiliary subunit